jgi:hypothetical protein
MNWSGLGGIAENPDRFEHTEILNQPGTRSLAGLLVSTDGSLRMATAAWSATSRIEGILA